MDFPLNSVRLIIDKLRGKDVPWREFGLACADLLKWGFTQMGTPAMEAAQVGDEPVKNEMLSESQAADMLQQACEHHGMTGSQPVGDFDWLGVLRLVLQTLLDHWH